MTMQARSCLVLFALSMALLSVSAQDRRGAAQQVASGSFDILTTISLQTNGSQDNAARRCKSNVEEAQSAERLGSRDMADKYWQVAARVCKVDAMLACKKMREVAPIEQCEQVQGLAIN